MTKFRALVGIFILQVSFGLCADSKVSLYSAKGVFTDDSGKSFSLLQLKGKKIVFAMAYTSCKGSCPLIVKRMQKLESKLKQQKVVAEFVAVSFDPQRDTPENLRRFRRLMKVTAPTWHFLSAPDSVTRDLANMLNIRFARIADSGEFSHDNKILLIDEQGHIVRTLESLNEPLEALY